MAENGLTPGALTPTQRQGIQEASDAVERLHDACKQTTGMTADEVYDIVTCNGQRPMTLQLFKNALNHLRSHNDQLEYLRLKKMFEPDERSH